MMHRTQILFEPEQYQALRSKSRQTGRSVGELVREAVDKSYLKADADRRAAAVKRLTTNHGYAVGDPADLKKELQGLDEVKLP